MRRVLLCVCVWVDCIYTHFEYIQAFHTHKNTIHIVLGEEKMGGGTLEVRSDKIFTLLTFDI